VIISCRIKWPNKTAAPTGGTARLTRVLLLSNDESDLVADAH